MQQEEISTTTTITTTTTLRTTTTATVSSNMSKQQQMNGNTHAHTANGNIANGKGTSIAANYDIAIIIDSSILSCL